MQLSSTIISLLALALTPLVQGGPVSVEEHSSPSKALPELLPEIPTRSLHKRDDWTCYGSTSATALDDCQAAISKIEAHGGNSTFMLREGICLNWIQGSCGVRFCAMPYVQKPLNRTAEWLATYATSPLLDCVKGGQWGLMGDHANINSNAGTYRLHLEYHT